MGDLSYYTSSALFAGPVLIGAGLMTIMFSIEICLRLCKAMKRVQDPDLDNLVNPHEVKHWMDPNIIPYGWGLFNEEIICKGLLCFSISDSQ